MQGQGKNALLVPIAIVASVLVLWEIAVWLAGIKPYLLPSPTAIALGLVKDRAIIFANVEVTLIEIVIGFTAAAVVAFAAGTVVAFSPTMRRAVYPLIVASQTVPVIAIAPVLIIWFGYNIWPRVIVTALIAFFPLTVNVVAGFTSVEPELVVFFRSLHASRLALFFKLSLPSALPFIFAGLRITAVLAVIGATVSEWIGSESGLGYLIALDTSQLDTVRVFASIAVLSGIGIALFSTVVGVEWVVLPWRYAPQKVSLLVRLVRPLALVVGSYKREDRMKAGLIPALALSILALADGRAPAQQPDKATFALSFRPDATFSNIIALGDRFAKENGLDINVIAPGSAADAVKLLASDTAQFGMVSSQAVILARAQGVPIISIVAPLQVGPIGTLAPIESGIRSVKDIEGKTIGITGVPANRAMLMAMLRANQVDLDKTKIVQVGFGDAPLLLAGKIDAIGDAIAFAEPIEFNKGRGKPLSDTSSYVFFPIYQHGGPLFYMFDVCVTEAYRAQHADTIRKFVKAWREASDWAIKNPDDAVKLFVKHYPETDYDLGVAEWKAVVPWMQSDDTRAQGLGWQNPKVWSGLADFMYENKLVTTPVDPAQSYTDAYFPK